MKKKQKSAVWKGFLLCLFILLILIFVSYFLLAYYYRSGFSVNTWINGVYCTGKTVEEINEELMASVEAPVIVVSTNSGWDVGYKNTIDLGEMDYQCDYLSALNEFMEKQNPYQWVENITFRRNHELEPNITYDETALREAFEQTCLRHYSDKPFGDFVIGIDLKGWYCYDGLTHIIDVDKAFELVKEAIGKGKYAINIDELDCFYDIPFTETQEHTRKIWERLFTFMECDLVYDMGDREISMYPEGVSFFLQYEYREDLKMDFPLLDEQGQFILNEEKIRDYVAMLAQAFDTYDVEREFQSTRGDLITVPAGGTYGTTLDQEAEVRFLLENLLSEELHDGQATLHVPEYLRQGFVRGKDDIGGTYIEVDMTQQHMYYYVDGELVLDTDVVTGDTGRRRGTPQGVNYVYNKQRNRVLRGPGYASPVKYWMPVKGSVGIHDAGWRSSFGGEIYKTNGSHGCINVPKDVMGELYEMVEVGTPVITFY